MQIVVLIILILLQLREQQLLKQLKRQPCR